MAHYAFLDENNVVTQVIVGLDETELIEGKDPEKWYSDFSGQRCLRTSYNAKIRKNFAGIGFIYDESKDAFIPPKPFPSWFLHETSCRWIAPKPKPDGFYTWNEEQLEWVEIDPQP